MCASSKSQSKGLPSKLICRLLQQKKFLFTQKISEESHLAFQRQRQVLLLLNKCVHQTYQFVSVTHSKQNYSWQYWSRKCHAIYFLKSDKTRKKLKLSLQNHQKTSDHFHFPQFMVWLFIFIHQLEFDFQSK